MKKTFTIIGLVAVTLTLDTTSQAADQTWDGGSSGSGSAWLSGSNWIGDPSNPNVPGSATTTSNADIATFQANGTGGTIGINMNTTGGNYYVGAISMSAGISRNIGNSSSALAGVLRLNGATVNSVANVVLRNNNTNNFTIQASQSGGGTMGLALGNATENKVVIDSTGNIVIDSIVSSSAGSRPLTIMGSGSGRVDITNASNTFTGDIKITGSEVRFSNAGSYGNVDNVIIIDGGRLASVNSGTYTIASTHAISIGDTAGTSISTPGSGTLTYNGIIANISGKTGAWAKQGGGTLDLGGVSTYTGNTAINNGALRLSTGNDRLPTGTAVSLGQASSTNLGTLDLNGRNQQIAGLQSTTGTNAGTSTNIVTSSTAATLKITTTDNFTYSEGTAANSGIISGAISLEKAGAGTQTLGGSNTYSGATLVSAGSLFINGSLANTTSTSVSAGAILAANGTIANGVTIAGSGKMAIGANDLTATLGSVTVGSLALSGLLEFGATGALTYDKLISTGALAVTSGTVAFKTSGYTVAHNTSFDIADFGSFSGTPTFDFSGASVQQFGAWDTSAFATSGVISYVPEPSSSILFGTFGTLALLRRRR